MIGEYVTIRDQDHRIDSDGPQADSFVVAKVVVGDRVWLGAKVTVTRGSNVGDHVVVGANAMVRGVCVAGKKYGGVPAKQL